MPSKESIHSEFGLMAALDLDSGSYDMNLENFAFIMPEYTYNIGDYDFPQVASTCKVEQGSNFAANVFACDEDMAGMECNWLPSHVDSRNMYNLGVSRPTDGALGPSNAAPTPRILQSNNIIDLVSKIQQQLQQLEESPWHTDSKRSLDDYPIGAILEISQQFSAIASSVFYSTTCDDDTNSNMADTPVILLAMTGYLWLVRIYSLILSHFQNHLCQIPASHLLGNSDGFIKAIANGGNGTNATATDQILRLGEVSCGAATFGLLRMQTVLNMLLDILQKIEGYVGRRGTVARDTALALLCNLGELQEDVFGNLSKKATEVKELLREKMGF